MKLHDPVKDFNPGLYPNGDVTQYFGENKALYAASVCHNGKCMVGGHNGWDIVRPWGEPIFCVESGRVADVNENPNGYGKHVRIVTDANGGICREWVYGHLSRIDVALGHYVQAGHQIGLMGNTGFVVSGATPYWKVNPYAGTHLHIGFREGRVWDGTGTWDITYLGNTDNPIHLSILNYDNGTFGSVPLKAEYFNTQTKPIGPDKDLTVQSLLNYAAQLDLQGNPRQAAIVRAVAGIVKAFAT